MKQNKVVVERVAPLTKNGIKAMSCSDVEYNWYCKGMEDREQVWKKRMKERIKILKRTTSKLIFQGWSNDTAGWLKMEEALLQNIDDVFKENIK